MPASSTDDEGRNMTRDRDSCWRWFWQAALLLGMACAARAQEFDAAGWRTVSAADLAMTAEPAAPDAAAIYLYTQLDWDDAQLLEKAYYQIKVLTESGREHANVEIRYQKEFDTIADFQARVIQPDGTIVPFSGTIYDKALAASDRSRKGLYAKSLRAAGCARRQHGGVPLHRRRAAEAGFLAESRWVLTQAAVHAAGPLFAEADAGNLLGVRWVAAQGWPPGTQPARADQAAWCGWRRVACRASWPEVYMPPVANVLYTVEFIPERPLLQPGPVLVRSTPAGTYAEFRDFTKVTAAVRKAAGEDRGGGRQRRAEGTQDLRAHPGPAQLFAGSADEREGSHAPEELRHPQCLGCGQPRLRHQRRSCSCTAWR